MNFMMEVCYLFFKIELITITTTFAIIKYPREKYSASRLESNSL